MLRHASLDHSEQNMIVGHASGDYNIRRIPAALRSAYRNKHSYSASLNTHSGDQFLTVRGLSSPSTPLDCYYKSQCDDISKEKRSREKFAP